MDKQALIERRRVARADDYLFQPADVPMIKDRLGIMASYVDRPT